MGCLASLSGPLRSRPALTLTPAAARLLCRHSPHIFHTKGLHVYPSEATLSSVAGDLALMNL